MNRPATPADSAPAAAPFELPMRGARSGGGRRCPKAGGDADGGYAVFACRDLAHALETMRAYPQARMPCWQRIEARAEVARV